MLYCATTKVRIEADDYNRFRLNVFRNLYRQISNEVFKRLHPTETINPSYPVKITEALEFGFRDFKLNLHIFTEEEFRKHNERVRDEALREFNILKG